MDDFWKKIYEAMMTPLPPPKQLELDKLFEFLRNTPNLPEAPNLPTAPAWLEQYARERGLHPDQTNSIQQPPQPTLMEALGRNRAQGY